MDFGVKQVSCDEDLFLFEINGRVALAVAMAVFGSILEMEG